MMTTKLVLLLRLVLLLGVVSTVVGILARRVKVALSGEVEMFGARDGTGTFPIIVAAARLLVLVLLLLLLLLLVLLLLLASVSAVRVMGMWATSLCRNQAKLYYEEVVYYKQRCTIRKSCTIRKLCTVSKAVL
jgi:hypothetical protein